MDYKLKNTGDALTAAFSNANRYKGTLAKTLILPMAVVLTLRLVPLESLAESYWMLVYFPVLLLSHVVVAVTTHRVVLLGPDSVPEWGLMRITKRELRFIAFGITIALLYALPILAFAQAPVGIVFGILAASYIAARVSLVFPAVATDRYWTLAQAWEAAQPHQFMLIIVVVVFPLLIGTVEGVFSSIPGFFLVAPFLTGVTNVLVVSALSAAYKIVVTEMGRKNTDDRNRF